MGLYYSYVNREGETVTSPYGDDTDNLDNGRIALELSYQNFPFEDIALYSGANSDFYQFKLYTEIDGHRSPYLELTVAEPSSASLREVALSNYTGSYTSADLWLNIGATLKPNLPEESTVEYYLATDEDGIDRVDSIAGKTVKASEMTNVTGMSHGQGRRDGLRIKDLAAGEYYVVVKLTEPAMNEGEEANIEQKIFPFTVYENADAYVKAALDKLLNYYMTGKGSFSFNQLNENGEYEYYGMTKVNASSFTGDGRSWEAMAFTSLGTEYPYGDETFSFAIDGDVLASHVDGTSRLDQWNANPQERTFESTGAKSLFRFSMAAAAMGGDPRATAGGNDMIHELIRGGYVDYDIEKGELNLDAQGKLSIEPDGFALSYALLTLEICHATEEEGFTKEFREAGAKPILETLKQFNEKEGKSGVSADTVGMIFLPLHWLAEDEVLDADLRAEIKAELAKMNSVVAKPENRNVNGGVAWFKEDSLNNDLYAVNTNSMAVLMNMLVLNGATAEEIGSWQSEDGTLLTALIGTQLPDGQFGFSGMVDSWLATYQTLGALVDLYNGRSFYEYAQDTYDATYPQYSDAGQEVANQLKALPETIESVEDIEAVNEARTAYEAFMANLPEKADVAAVESYFADLETALSDAEAATTQFVKDLIEDLPEPDLQTEADAEAVSAARAAFDALTDDEAAAVTKAERAKLERAENAADTIAADEVERQLLALPAADKVVAADGEAITAARAAFEALTEDQQKLVSGEAAAKLVNDERALEQLGAAPVVHEIDAIPDAADLSLDDKDYVEQVRANYDALSDVQKLAVTNVADLIKAETKLQKLAEKAAADEAAAAAVDEAIADLGKAENIGVNDEDAVKAARKAFDKLSDDAKALVTAEDDLIAAEEALAAAKDEAAKAAAAEEAAEKAEKAIDDIGDVTLDSEKAIAKAREIYDALSDDEKALVENGDALAAAEEALAQLKDEAEQAAAEEEAAAKAAADQKAAAKVAAAIDAIGDVTLGDEKAIAKARNDYDALTDDQKDLVDNAADLDAAEAALDQLKEDKAAADEAAKEAADKAAADRAAADAVQSAIDALGEGDDITAADAKAVSAARKAYDRLTDDQKALVDNEDALTAAEEAVAAAKEAAVKEAEEAAKEAEEQAKAAEEAERAAKEAADKAAADKAAADKAAADKAAADAVQSAIDALGESDDITATDAKAVSAARKAYDRLTDDQKALVDNEDALTAAEDAVAEAKLAAAEAKAAEEAAKAIAAEAAAEAEQAAKEAAEQAAADKAAADKAAADKAAADAVQSAIDALGESDDITAADGKAVSAARKAYDRLTDDQKALVDNEAALTAAEDAVAQAKADAKKAEEEAKAAAEKAAKDAADKEAAAAAEKAIEAIGEVTKDSAAAVEAARAAFDALTDDQKALVGNEETLKAAEEKLAALSNRRFVDVPADAYFSEAVDWAVANNITTGTDDTHFSPNDGCTRAQVVTFLWRAAGSPAAAAENPFSDVAAGSYYEKAVLWAVENGITTGTGEGTFSPNDVCTRSQVVTFLWRAKGSPAAAGENPFSDVEAGSFYEQAVLWAVANSVTTGTGDTTFGPKETCTRGQVVTFLFRAR
ncbi:MAG: S-layer homology domain-containing protein [Bacillota bacterium]